VPIPFITAGERIPDVVERISIIISRAALQQSGDITLGGGHVARRIYPNTMRITVLNKKSTVKIIGERYVFLAVSESPKDVALISNFGSSHRNVQSGHSGSEGEPSIILHRQRKCPVVRRLSICFQVPAVRSVTFNAVSTKSNTNAVHFVISGFDLGRLHRR